MPDPHGSPLPTSTGRAVVAGTFSDHRLPLTHPLARSDLVPTAAAIGHEVVPN